MSTLPRRTYIEDQRRTDLDLLPIAGPSSLKRHSAISTVSELTAETRLTPPHTPPTSYLPIPAVDWPSTLEESEGDGRRREHRAIRRARSAERTRKWAEDVQTHCPQAERRGDDDQGTSPREIVGTLSRPDIWDPLARVMNALVDELNPVPDQMSHLPDADRVISKLTRKSIKLSDSSDSEQLGRGSHGSRPARGSSSETTRRAEGGKERKASAGKQRLRTRTQGEPFQSVKPTARLSSVSTSAGPLSIDDIIRKHAGAVDGAMAVATERARKDLGLSTPTPPITPARPTTKHTSRSPTSSRPPATPKRTTSLTDKPGSGPHSPPLRNSSLPLPRSPLSQSRSLDEASGQARESVERNDAGKPSAEEAFKDFLMGQALLDRLETASDTSSQVKGPASSPLRPTRTAAPTGRVASSPTPSRSTSKSDRKSLLLGQAQLEDDSPSIAVYLRSARLTHIIRLPRPFPERPLHVSLADLGSPSGTPVLIFLGIGCVRQLIALFDDLARALGLRLICIDRWGFGKTTNVPQEGRGPMEWAVVVERVLAELGVEEVRLIAHSAGAPYAAATALLLGERVKGKINFLAPWVNAEIDGGFRWLKWVPNGVIKSAFAAEWKLQSYRLGKPPPLVHKPVSNTEQSEATPSRSSQSRKSSQLAVSGTAPPSPTSSPGSARTSLAKRTSQLFSGRNEATFSAGSLPSSSSSPPQPFLARLEEVAPISISSADRIPSHPSFNSSVQTSSVSQASVDSERLKSPDATGQYSADVEYDAETLASLVELTTISPKRDTACVIPEKPPTDAALLHALDQASHAECEPGTTDDLLTIILNRPARSWGFSYADLKQPATIWWGSEDERVSEKSVRWMERVMCEGTELKIVPGGDHNLMRSVPVMCDIFQAIADEARRARQGR